MNLIKKKRNWAACKLSIMLSKCVVQLTYIYICIKMYPGIGHFTVHEFSF